jgi:hypothetical protein
MKTICTLCFLAFLPVAVCLAETDPSTSETMQPTLLDHMRAMEQSQERLMKLSPEDQARLQPQIRQAELEACKKLNQDREKGVGMDDYQAQGGGQFAAFVMQFEQYCKSLR